MSLLVKEFATALNAVRPDPDRYAVEIVDLILRQALAARASDVHLIPQPERQLQMLWRIDGVLTPISTLTKLTPNIVARLKVLSNLLTYRSDVPQEGRVQMGMAAGEIRISTFPTLHGEKVVARLFVASGGFHHLEDLGLAPSIQAQLGHLLTLTAGVVILAGPAGSGKTTTLYASLRTIQRDPLQLRSLCTLEDPVEALLPGIAQSQVKPGTEFTYQRGLASLMRQDPDVIMVGEIRDRETAETVFQASLTGQLVLTSFHAGSAAEALSRVSDMGIEPYVIRSGLAGVLAQQLLRKRCPCCCLSKVSAQQEDSVCERCRGCGYAGRMVVSELLSPALPELDVAILRRAPAPELNAIAIRGGMVSLLTAARQAVADGLTTELEVYRVFGPDGR